MTEFRIVHRGRDDRFGNYRFDVLLNDKKVAEIEHDYRGDEHFVKRLHGEWIATDRIIVGGGPEPLELSTDGIAIINKLLEK